MITEELQQNKPYPVKTQDGKRQLCQKYVSESDSLCQLQGYVKLGKVARNPKSKTLKNPYRKDAFVWSSDSDFA